MITIHTIEFASPEYDEAVALRQEVLRKPLGLAFLPEQLGNEWTDTHLAAFDASGRMVGILILTALNSELVKMRQVAVTPELQGQGIGAQLVKASEALAKSMGFRKITLHARETAMRFYRRLEYQTIGERFLEVNIPHFEMEKVLD